MIELMTWSNWEEEIKREREREDGVNFFQMYHKLSECSCYPCFNSVKCWKLWCFNIKTIIPNLSDAFQLPPCDSPPPTLPNGVNTYDPQTVYVYGDSARMYVHYGCPNGYRFNGNNDDLYAYCDTLGDWSAFFSGECEGKVVHKKIAEIKLNAGIQYFQ